MFRVCQNKTAKTRRRLASYLIYSRPGENSGSHIMYYLVSSKRPFATFARNAPRLDNNIRTESARAPAACVRPKCMYRIQCLCTSNSLGLPGFYFGLSVSGTHVRGVWFTIIISERDSVPDPIPAGGSIFTSPAF